MGGRLPFAPEHHLTGVSLCVVGEVVTRRPEKFAAVAAGVPRHGVFVGLVFVAGVGELYEAGGIARHRRGSHPRHVGLRTSAGPDPFMPLTERFSAIHSFG